MNKDDLHSLAFVWLVVQIWYRDLASENGEVTISRFSSSQSSSPPARSTAGQIEPPRRRWWHRPTRCGRWSPTSPRSPPPPAAPCPHALLLQQPLIPHHGRQRGAEESPRAHRSIRPWSRGSRGVQISRSSSLLILSTCIYRRRLNVSNSSSANSFDSVIPAPPSRRCWPS